MNFTLSEEHLMIREAARDFTQMELLPGVIERDEKQEFPTQQIKQLAELGFMGMMVSPDYGGSGMDTLSYVLAMEELSKVDASASVVVSVNNSLVCWGLETYGTDWFNQGDPAMGTVGVFSKFFGLTEKSVKTVDELYPNGFKIQ